MRTMPYSIDADGLTATLPPLIHTKGNPSTSHRDTFFWDLPFPN